MILNVLKIFGLSTFAFFLALFCTPALTHFLYKYKMWKKKPRLDGEKIKGVSDNYREAILRHGDTEIRTPRMGGILIWASTLIVVFIFWFLARIFPMPLAQKLNFLSREQTWLPLFTLIAASLIGLVDDLVTVFSQKGIGLSLRKRIILVLILGAVGGWWFSTKLGVHSVIIPFLGEFNLGPIIAIPFLGEFNFVLIGLFILVMLAIFSGGVIDGIDGLSGGVMASIFAAYGGIAFFQNQIDLATFCAVIVGGILAFLWFNIPPARFYMGETGILGLTTALTVVAFLTKAVVVLPVIALPLIVTSASNIIQLFSKRFFHRKIFRVAPLHHHFEAIGWPSYKVVMRYWIISVILAVVGMVMAMIG